jgi:hypothetical protein
LLVRLKEKNPAGAHRDTRQNEVREVAHIPQPGELPSCQDENGEKEQTADQRPQKDDLMTAHQNMAGHDPVRAEQQARRYEFHIMHVHCSPPLLKPEIPETP